MKRVTRLLNAFSKKFENHAHMVARYTIWYNFVKLHKKHRISPAMAAGASDRLWSMEDIAALVEAAGPAPGKRGPTRRRPLSALMGAYDFLKDFAGPISTTVAATTAATVAGIFAYRQAKTAELQAEIALNKLKLDAIDDRIDVMEATRELIKYVATLRHGEMPDIQKMHEMRYRTLKGRFLFKKTIYDQIDKIVDQCFDVPSFVQEARGRPLDDYAKEAIRKSGEAKVFVVKSMDKLPSIFEGEISLSLFKEEDRARDLAQARIKYLTLVALGVVGLIFLALSLAVVAVR